MPQSMGWQRVGHDWATKLNWTESLASMCIISCFSHVWFFVTLRNITCQSPLSMEFSRQDYCSGLPCPPPVDFPNPGIEPGSPVLQAQSLLSEILGSPYICICTWICIQIRICMVQYMLLPIWICMVICICTVHTHVYMYVPGGSDTRVLLWCRRARFDP